MAQKFQIREQGQTETRVLEVKPRHVLRSMREDKDERFKDLTPGESGYRIAWFAAETDLEFDAWIDSLDELSPVNEKDDEKDDEDTGAALNPTSDALPSSSSAEASSLPG